MVLMTASTIAICVADIGFRRTLSDEFVRRGFVVDATASAAEVMRSLAGANPSVLVLELALPDADGRDVCQALRTAGMRAPVLFLTARDALPDRLSGFHAGADDYLVKPFAVQELLVRIAALLRRERRPPAAPPTGLHLDPAAHALRWLDRHAMLTPTEFRLLSALAARAGEVIRRMELVYAAWPDGAIVHDNTLDAYISRLRAKLREIGAPAGIETVRGVGYVLQ
jgi:two-component system, OmpR family, response regulator